MSFFVCNDPPAGERGDEKFQTIHGACRKKHFFFSLFLTNSMGDDLYNHFEKDDANAL